MKNLRKKILSQLVPNLNYSKAIAIVSFNCYTFCRDIGVSHVTKTGEIFFVKRRCKSKDDTVSIIRIDFISRNSR